jgi:hypothetical protein
MQVNGEIKGYKNNINDKEEMREIRSIYIR